MRGGNFGGILKYSMFILPTAVIPTAVTFRLGIILLMICALGVDVAIIPIPWNVPVPSNFATL